MSLAPRQILQDRYLILDILDQGSLSQTYLAHDQEHGLDVVVKELHLHQLDNWKSHELFEREARVLQNIQHAGIPRWVDFFGDDLGGRLFLVTEKITGQTWLEKIERGWRPGQTELDSLIEQSLDILDYLHQLSPAVIHRDIKPSNLMLDQEGQVHLIDFGVAQDLLHPEGGRTVVGTFGYMAPEQFSGQAVPASDLYGLGMSLIHLLSGRRPSEMNQSGQRVQFEDYIQVPEALKLWLGGMVAPQLALRYRSAAEARESLMQLRQGKTATLRSENLPQPQRKQLNKPLIVGAALAVTIITGAAYQRLSSRSVKAEASYQGPCFSQPYILPQSDQSTEAQAFRADFESRFPRPDWWDQVNAPVFDHLKPFLSYWQCKQRPEDRAFFKAAYQSILEHPLNDELAVTAINLMPYGDPEYPQLTALLTFGLENYYYDRNLNGSGGSADRVGGILRHLAQRQNKAAEYAKNVTLIKRFFSERGNELNPQIYQLIALEYARALWQSGDPANALKIITQAKAKPGDWGEKLDALQTEIQAG